ncbi:MAG TPA: rhombosortase [Steroidobacteraceae bacterium]|nr:rhombosortase [Steroidobacteraceae bacterium]
MRLSVNAGLSLVVTAVLAAELFLPAGMFEYRRALAAREPWRLLTGHVVHLGFLHALLNCVALVLIGRLFADRLTGRAFFGILGIAPILISILFLVALPELHWYRGLSGVLHALFFAGCVVWIAATTGRARWLPVAALIGGTVKVLLEQPWDGSFPVHEVLRAAVVPQAHLIGAIVGAAAGLVLRRQRSRSPA